MKPNLLKGSRSRYLAVFIFVIAAIFVARLFYLQIIQNSHYRELASIEQVKRELIPAMRGEIYALSGDKPVKLVTNETVYTVFADPAIIKEENEREVVDVMQRIAGGNVVDNFAKLLTNKESRYAIIAKKVTRTQAEKIKAEGLSGIGFQAVSQRFYPEGAMAAQLLGFVNAAGEGNYGLEGYMNEALSGKDGRLETVVDISDVPLTIGDRNIRKPAVNGDDLVLSVDRNVQSRVEEVVKSYAEKYGEGTAVSALVMNPNNGQVMAMANYPSYDPAKYYEVTDASLFTNRVISIPYEPGSVIKTYTLSTAIDKNAVKPSDTFFNSDTIKVGDRTIGNATHGITGTITFQTAMNYSLNTGSVTMAMRLGNGTDITSGARDTMYEYFHDRLGLGTVTGIELSGEARGIVVPSTDVDGNAVRYSNMTFGQGLNVTSLQIAAGFSAIINGGNYYQPTVIAGKMVDGAFQPAKAAAPVRSNVIKNTTSEQLREVTHGVREFTSAWRDKPGYYIGGKTGTAQVIKGGDYAKDESIGTYLGFGGSSRDDPRYVIMVSVSGDHRAFGGGEHAGPVFGDISDWLLDYLKIQPKG